MNISGVQLLNISSSGYANPLEDEGTLTEQEKEVKKMDKKTMTETINDLMEKQKAEKEIVNDERPAGVYRLPHFLKPKELEKERQRILNNIPDQKTIPIMPEVKPPKPPKCVSAVKEPTPCERAGHNYRVVWHDEKSISHRTLLVCAKCGATKEVLF